MKSLFESVQFGELKLKNRIVMSPLTRSRATDDRIPNDIMVQYYSDRAGAGMILTEATSVMPEGVGYANTPGIWSEEQVAGWKKITDAVHAKNGLIILQLWHVGRISHSSFLNGKLPSAPSAIAADGEVSLLRPKQKFETPRALTVQEIADVVQAFRKGAENAKRAGFDGVEIHGANGYLQDQFLQTASNHRTDQYGGSVENRARFLLETVDAATSVFGPGRVGVHLAPRGDSHSMGDANPVETFSFVARELKKRNVAFIFIRESLGEGYLTPTLKEAFGGPVIVNQLSQEDATKLLNEGSGDAVAFGRLYIANPDLAERLQANAPLNVPDHTTFYAPGNKGYNDYPFLGK